MEEKAKKTDANVRYQAFEKLPVATVVFQMIMGDQGKYENYKTVYRNEAMNKLVQSLLEYSVCTIVEGKCQALSVFVCETANSGEQRKKIAYVKENEKYYELIAYVDEEEYVVCVIADVTEKIREHKRQSERFHYEVEQNIDSDSYPLWEYCRYNMTRNRIEHLEMRDSHKKKEAVLKKETNYLARMRAVFDDVELNEEQCRELERENLIEQYYAGMNEKSLEFFAKEKGSQKQIFLHLDCKVLRHPETGEILAFFYTKDWTKEYIERYIMESIFKKDYDYVGVIFVGAQNRFFCMQNKTKYQKNFVEGIFDEAIERSFKRYCVSDDVDEKIKENSIEEIEKHLLLKPLYKTEVDFINPADGTINRKNIRYSYVDREKHIISINQVDVESVVRKEKEKKNQLEAALNLAERANNAKSEFLATVSHEIRTPMNVVLGLTDLAKSEIENKEVLLDYLNKIEISGKHLLQLVNDVLDMSKIESGEFHLRPVIYSLKSFLNNMRNYVSPLCEQKDITFEIVADRNLPDVYADKLRLEQIFINIISNAVKFTPSCGKVVFSLQTKCENDVVLCQFKVSDNGIGMSEDFQANMFKPFTREEGQATQMVQGTGLGLAIAYGIIKKMDGNIRIESKKNEGTTFFIDISFEEAKLSCVKEKKYSEEKKLLTGKSVLIVEDHQINQMILGKMLQNQGAKVFYAENGKIACEMFKESEEHTYDIIFMDIRMPVMDGLTATKKIRSLKRHDAKSIPIIAMTANAYDEDREKSERAGINVHLSKPINSTILCETVSQILFDTVSEGQ